jgi:ElaB/YqjD/DUF883 family membrane-anchored ribosome-binding protein
MFNKLFELINPPRVDLEDYNKRLEETVVDAEKRTELLEKEADLKVRLKKALLRGRKASEKANNRISNTTIMAIVVAGVFLLLLGLLLSKC